jgi:hypothetical protein
MSTLPGGDRQAVRLVGDEKRLRSDSHIAIHTETYAIDEDALGTHLPKRYYFSRGFIGTVVVYLPP